MEIIRPAADTARNFVWPEGPESVMKKLFLLLFQRSPHPLWGEREVFDADSSAAGQGIGDGRSH